MEWRQGEYVITDDPARVDLDALHAFLVTAYWCEGIPREIVERSVRNSLNFPLFHGSRQVGFARVVTDRATFAWVADVYVLPEERGRGLAKWLMSVVTGHPSLAGLRRWTLATRDAHGLYQQFGFTPPAKPERMMEIARPGIYRGEDAAG
jgi:GNAT superfamily N-acetyltransferase